MKPKNIVYFAQAASENKLIKIGAAHRIDARMTTLRAQNAGPVVLLGIVPAENASQVARELRAQFHADLHHGEWFYPSDVILAYITEHTKQPIKPISKKRTRKLLTPLELAHELKMSVRTIRRYVRAKQLPVLRVGRSLRFDLDDVRAALFALQATS